MKASFLELDKEYRRKRPGMTTASVATPEEPERVGQEFGHFAPLLLIFAG
jgi:hypothetical protein